ncbi:MAG: molybdopterin molybdotransferase MoeA [Chlorobi bacterium]|nr:molybdopterin molybdotransferase MoeA [Chlorobiota bacterium]
MISYSEALQTILDEVITPLPSERVPLVLSLGRTVAEGIVATEQIPAYNNSAMDGYAVLSEDTRAASQKSPARLRVIGEAPAGAPFQGSVEPGTAVRIMTGGIVPDGANAVVEVESTEEKEDTVHVLRSVSVGSSIRLAGEDIKIGEEIIPVGKRLQPGDIGVLASLGITNVPVRIKPKVGILATGNEVIEPHRKPEPGQLRNSNGPALYAACVRAGAEPIDLGIAEDDRNELLDSLETGLQYDLLLTTGGVSAGDYDLLQTLLPELGVKVRFHKANIKPGKPVLFGLRQEGERKTLVFGLPGNPVSSLVTFQVFAVPAITSMLGEKTEGDGMTALLEDEITKKDNKRHFMRGVLQFSEDGNPTVSITGTQSSGAMSSMSKANCFILIDEETQHVGPGEPVRVKLI